MPRLHKSIVVSAPAEKVFEVLTNFDNLDKIAPGVSGVTGIQTTSSHVGDNAHVTYSVMGLRFPMTLTTTEYKAPSRLGQRMEGGMAGDFNWVLEPQGDACRIMLDIEYEMKGGIIGKAVDRLLVERMNETNAQHMLENLKVFCESGVRAPTR